MRALLLLAALAAAAPARALPLEVELGGGAAFASDTAPALSLRAGWEFFRHLTISARYVGLDQPPQTQLQLPNPPASPNPWPSTVAYQAWAAMAEANLHTAGNVQVGLALDVGVGKANLLYPSQNGPGPSIPAQGTVGPCGQISVTARVLLPLRLFAAIELGGDVWTGLTELQKSGAVTGGNVDSGILTLLEVGWRPF